MLSSPTRTLPRLSQLGWRGRVGLVLGAVLGLFLLVGGYISFRVLSPRQDVPESADAVVALAGGEGERLDRALELMDDGVAPVLVLHPGEPFWRDYDRVSALCPGAGGASTAVSESAGYDVFCVDADPDDTKGEATVVAALAEEQGWEHLVVVTSRDHLHRATLRFDQCFDGRVDGVAAQADSGFQEFTHEWFGIVEATLLDRSC